MAAEGTDMAPGGRAKATIFVAVWGAAYIARFSRYGLAAFLAPGNLPALVASCDVELVILTRRLDQATFAEDVRFKQAAALAPARFVAIDDLVTPGAYAVTLTLAFTRGLALYGDAVTERHCIFWNADFVIANGGFAYLGKRIARGETVALCGTLRAVAEDVEPVLNGLCDAAGVLTMAPRAMVKLTLDHLHPTHKAALREGGAYWVAAPRRFFWKAGETALLGRFFQIFMLCLKPARAVAAIHGPCDYSFLPEYCPGAAPDVIGDSDELFILELQDRDAEASSIRFGAADESAQDRDIEEWWTPEHLDSVRRPVLFHTGDVDARACIARSANAINAIAARLRPPTPHIGQYYWVSGVAWWRVHRLAAFGPQADPPELDLALAAAALKHPTNSGDWARRALTPARLQRARGGAWLHRHLKRLIGDPPDAPRLHPDWRARRVLAALTQEIQFRAGTPDQPALIVAELGDWPDLYFPLDDERFYRAEPHVAAAWKLEAPPLLHEALFYFRAADRAEPEACVRNAARALKPGAPVTVIVHDGWGRHGQAALEAHARRLLPLDGVTLDEMEIRFVRLSGAEAALRRGLASAIDSYRQRGGVLGVAACAWGLLCAGMRRLLDDRDEPNAEASMLIVTGKARRHG